MTMNFLAIHWHVDPVLIHLGNFGIRWYSLLFVAGFVIGWYLFRWFFRREGVSEKLLDPLLYTLLIATIVGARLGHCLFYQPDYYLGSWQGFWEIFMPWKGGLASHGGAIALLLGMWWYSSHYGKKNDFDYLWILDRLVITVAFAGCLIRLGNLFNSEIYGDVTTLPWGFVFDLRGETEPKHPTQLYEALSYLLLGLFLVWVYAKKLDKVHRGFFLGTFLLCCFGMRFLIEFIKEPQVEFEQTMALNMGQLLSIPFIIGGIAILIYAARSKRPAAIVHPEPVKKEGTHYAKPLR
ncbi:MAG: prolipoprotein diacylglyceryl transferase [Bacteroidales bacterium]|nr:prolipoprotein diacylglyceryl transferase [Bacteroidales bacterium]MBR0028655.1 prolipoprotein diacylglyceryl transferase [Bacteroidales bacterium]MBR0084748.1 prolipoprotein diacylglyceryl transferase [Bacteroidales bacterium]MBR0290953.1 prolipoprotein diacylglyceryl transferase [Bacteroidales bacterium]